MQRKVAVIDIGSNTSRLVIMAYEAAQWFKMIDQVRERVRLFEGMSDDNRLRPEPIERTIHLLRVFRSLCDANEIDEVLAVGTSAVRDAANRDEFLERVSRETGLELRVLSGEEEAYYGYLGAINSIVFKNGVVVDIGGGSMQLTHIRARKSTRSISLPLGAVRLTEAFLHDNPPRVGQVTALKRHLNQQLDTVTWINATRKDDVLVGQGGTLRTLAKMDQRRRDYPIDRLHDYVLTRRAIEEIEKELRSLPFNQRKKLPGLSSDRADVILAGTLVLLGVMRQGSYSEVVVCGQGIREGLFYEQFLRDAASQENGTAASRVPDVRAFAVANLNQLYEVNWAHARHVETLALALFDQLKSLHGYGTFERNLLSNAALMHDAGVEIDYYNHHEHSAYLILNAELPGFSHREIALIAELARYHRRGNPKKKEFKGIFVDGDKQRIARLSALLRLAEYLERSRTQVVDSIRCHVNQYAVQIVALVRGDASTEVWSTERNAELFEKVYKRKLTVRAEMLPPTPVEVLTQVLPDDLVDALAKDRPDRSGARAKRLWGYMRELIRSTSVDVKEDDDSLAES